jgi:hypothetical protein
VKGIKDREENRERGVGGDALRDLAMARIVHGAT